MITNTDLFALLIKFIRIKVSYNHNFKTYQVNDLYTNEIDAIYFEEKAKEIESNLMYVMKVSKDNKSLLKELLRDIWLEIQSYNERGIHSFSFIKDYVTTVKGSQIEREPIDDRFTIDYVKNFNNDTDDDSPLLAHLKLYQEQANNYDDRADFELAKLLFVVQLHHSTLNKLYSIIYKIEMDFETLDIDGMISLNSNMIYESKNPKCNVNHDKITTANLFHILMIAGYLSIDKNDADNNKKQMLNFIENNFTYRDESGENHLITNLYKEFSYLDNIAHKRRQISIISKLISELQQELLKLKS
jgi:hypothetical protein